MPQTAIAASPRQIEIYHQYLQQLDTHLQELKEGKTERTLEIRELAALLHVHPSHLSNTIKEVTGKATCSFYEERLVELSKELLLTNKTIAQVAAQLTYDPSNFTKFFKRYTGFTPKQFRQAQLQKS
jgi:AraC family transcriptional regulator, regulatory protein of adaptative response / methylphosphotriester-DNA alkyltransferase methyltransferase